MRKSRFPVVLYLLVLIASACRPDGGIGGIARALDDLGQAGAISGVVLIARDGKPVLEKAYGFANRDHAIPNTMDTKFNLGSINKMFTAVAILQLVEEGKLTFEDRIIDHLPDYPRPDVAEKVTIHQLLTHTSGLGSFFTDEYLETPKDRFRTLADYLPLVADQPLAFDPGAQFSYSNTGYLVLGLIIEEVTGQSYYQHIREHIYQPCGMDETDSYSLDEVVPGIATGYTWDATNLYFLPARGSSAGGGYSTAGDLLKFSGCLLDHQLLSPELTDRMLESKIKADILGPGVGYGYGFFIIELPGQGSIVGHSGGSPGVCSNLDILPWLGYTVVILTNDDHDCQVPRIEILELLLAQTFQED